MFLAAGLMIYICVDSYLVTNTVTPPPKCGEGIMKLKDSLYDYETDEHCKPVKAYRKWGNFTSVYIFDQPVKKVEQPSLLDANAQLIVHCTPPEEFAIKIKSTFEVAWVHHQTEHAKEENAYKATARYKRRTIVTSVIPELRQLPDKSYAFITNLFTTYEYRATNWWYAVFILLYYIHGI